MEAEFEDSESTGTSGKVPSRTETSTLNPKNGVLNFHKAEGHRPD